MGKKHQINPTFLSAKASPLTPDPERGMGRDAAAVAAASAAVAAASAAVAAAAVVRFLS